MALADTAALVASLELQDKFTSTANKFDKTVAGMDAKTQRLSKLGETIGRGARSTIDNLGKIGLVAGGLIATQVAAGVRSLQALENVEAQTNAVLESTGGAAGVTADQVRALAEEYENLNATIDDKVIQSAENVLLTFTNINEDAFQPALEAALNLNQALGGGEEGLQGTIVQLGKALNDPVKGITALSRVGVSFTEKQKDRIAGLVEENDLYGAQQIILDELAKEFGGSFAAAGDTASGKFAQLGDKVEEVQQKLAVAFLPVLDKVTDKLTEVLSDPGFQRRVEDFGDTLADVFDQGFDFVTKLPWDTIATSLELGAKGAKGILDAFTSLPDWLQTAVITGWGLNKLTGGALGSIVGQLGKITIGGLAGGLRGNTPATPVFTKEVGIPGTGAPAPGGGGPGGLLSTLKNIALMGPPLFAIASILGGEGVFGGDTRAGAVAARQGAGGRGFLPGTPGFRGTVPVEVKNPEDIANAATPLGQFNPANMGGSNSIVGKLDELRDAEQKQGEAVRRGNLKAAQDALKTQERIRDLHPPLMNQNRRTDKLTREIREAEAKQRRAIRDGNLEEARNQQHIIQALHEQRDRADRAAQEIANRVLGGNQKLDAITGRLDGTNRGLATLNAKDFSPNVNVDIVTNTSIAISDVTRQLIVRNVATKGTAIINNTGLVP